MNDSTKAHNKNCEWCKDLPHDRNSAGIVICGHSSPCFCDKLCPCHAPQQDTKKLCETCKIQIKFGGYCSKHAIGKLIEDLKSTPKSACCKPCSGCCDKCDSKGYGCLFDCPCHTSPREEEFEPCDEHEDCKGITLGIKRNKKPIVFSNFIPAHQPASVGEKALDMLDKEASKYVDELCNVCGQKIVTPHEHEPTRDLESKLLEEFVERNGMNGDLTWLSIAFSKVRDNAAHESSRAILEEVEGIITKLRHPEDVCGCEGNYCQNNGTLEEVRAEIKKLWK